MEKICVFCGKRPENKNREHVIPQWLIKMTGDANRCGNWGIDYQELIFEERVHVKARKYPFMKFTFPACEKCNAEYGDKLETQAKSVIEKIHSNQSLEEKDISVLLDWFDKVRVGMWLGYLYYNSKDGILPKFCISERVGATDRALFIFKSETSTQGLTIFGPGSMLFSRLPIIFGMRINGYYYLNISKDFLISDEVGFPVPTEIKTDSEGNIGIETFKTGNEKIVEEEIWRKFFSLKPEIGFLQPIYKKYNKDFKDIYETEYIKKNSINVENGIGNIFYYNDGKFESFPKNETRLFITGEYVEENLKNRLAIIVSKYLIKTAEKLKLEVANKEVEEELDLAIIYQKFIMQNVIEK